MDNQKNLLLAVVFSLVILIGFDFFFAPNTNESDKKQLNEISKGYFQIGGETCLYFKYDFK